MKLLAAFVLILIIAVGLWLKLHGHGPASAPDDVYLGLRSRALNVSRAQIGIAPTADPSQPWAVIMDWGVEHGTATVVAMSDGTASIYVSGGGGFLGGQGQEKINASARRAVGLASEVQPQMHLTKDFPIPERGQVTFYLLTDDGVYTAQASEQELSENQSRFSRLGNAMQDVVTQYRLWSQQTKQ